MAMNGAEGSVVQQEGDPQIEAPEKRVVRGVERTPVLQDGGVTCQVDCYWSMP